MTRSPRLAAAGLVIMASACAPSGTATPGSSTDAGVRAPEDARALPPVSLPDVSRTSESVQRQLRERYASLTTTLANPGSSPVDRGEAYGEMGTLLMAAEYLEAAEPCYRHAQSLMPADVRWPYYLAHLYRLKNEPATSAAFFEKALQLRPDDVPTLVWLGGIYLDQGRAADGEALLRKALSLQPRSAAALFRLGNDALTRKDYGAAVKYFEETLALDRRASIVHYPLALAYRGLGDLKKAEAELKQRGDTDVALPDPLMSEVSGLLASTLSYETLGARALEKGEWSAAADYFRKGVALAPDNPLVRHGLGTALFMMGDARGALAQFEEVVRRSPDFAKAHYSLGVLMATSGQTQKAIEEFSAAVHSDANYVQARLRLAELLRRTKRLQDSLSQYEQVIRIDPAAAEARFGYAITLAGVGRYQDSRDRLSEGMTANPNQPVFAHALARLLAAAPDDRIRDGRRAMAIVMELRARWQSVELTETMAMALAASGQYEEAARVQRDVITAAGRGGRQDLMPRLTANLALYEQRQPCRVPWTDDEAIAVTLALQ